MSDVGFASRKDIKAMVKRKRVTVNGEIISFSDCKINTATDTVAVDGQNVQLLRRVVCILNKPAGYVTSTDDPRDATVMELIPKDLLSMGVVPAGRLDKDTEGLLVLTNDGDLIHKLISPKSEIRKVYYAEHQGVVSDEDVKAFSDGIVLKDGTVCKSAILEEKEPGRALITITEGMYHQVKRMMASRNLHVTYLKRLEEGEFSIGNLKTGEFTEVP